jgi:hypothetical protein
VGEGRDIMNKNPITEKPEIEEIEKQQGKKRKGNTICNDKRRKHYHCFICGSENIINQGISYCNNCEKEIEIFSNEEYFQYSNICDCEWKPYRKYYKIIKKCMTCGAVEAMTCPACHSYCWTSVVGEKYCRSCGFRKEKY